MEFIGRKVRRDSGVSSREIKPKKTNVAFVFRARVESQHQRNLMQRVSQSQLGILSRNIRRLREQAGLTQEQLAEKADISPRSIQFIEAAQFGASLAVLIRLRRAMDCQWDTLLAGIE